MFIRAGLCVEGPSTDWPCALMLIHGVDYHDVGYDVEYQIHQPLF
jgi:hypothetical protein